jgi:hypothetical protein
VSDQHVCELSYERDERDTQRILEALLGRCSEQNSTPAFRQAITQAIGCLERGESTSAATIIGETAANVSGVIHSCENEPELFAVTPEQELLFGHEWADRVRQMNLAGHPLQADEDSTDAYHVLDGLRFAFGYLHLGKVGNNVMILRGGGE